MLVTTSKRCAIVIDSQTDLYAGHVGAVVDPDFNNVKLCVINISAKQKFKFVYYVVLSSLYMYYVFIYCYKYKLLL